MRAHPQPPWRIGLTGGIGSGKSTVAAMLQALGAPVLDADALARACTAPGGTAIEPIRAAFGPQYIGPDGALDREQMRALVFAQPAARQRLEAIVHPLVRDAIEQACAQLQGRSDCVVLDIPLLPLNITCIFDRNLHLLALGMAQRGTVGVERRKRIISQLGAAQQLEQRRARFERRAALRAQKAQGPHEAETARVGDEIGRPLRMFPRSWR